MASYRLNNMAITIEKEASARPGFPIRFGKYSEIRTSEYEFHFNLKGEIKLIRGLNVNWPHPSECLKRTDGNDWVFYSVGSSVGENIFQCLGEYYLPCLPYPGNSIWEFNPFADPDVPKAFAAWSQLYANIYNMRDHDIPADLKEFLYLISDESVLHEQAKKLHSIIGGQVSVLPPDTRHVDYEVIPLTIADGCLYHCNFCSVKSHQRFQPRSEDSILQQISQLKAFYNRNLGNYNALFLGNHDALGAGEEVIRMAASEAVTAFGFGNPQVKNPALFLFGSVDSLLGSENKLFEELSSLPFYTYINVGFESVDAPTLASINKPLDISRIRDAFQKMLELNRDYSDIEITANFLLGNQLSPEHNQSLAEFLSDISDSFYSKSGAIYLSPLMDPKKRRSLMDDQKRSNLLKSFFEIKKQSRLPAYIYLIQRL
ncbi:radical SAM protein [Desulfococcaceae bacterium HSG8]|nr:radical SAM protein [Desulfococcaceae bacterium HSG8]